MLKKSIIVVILLLLFFSPRIYWQFKEKIELDILVVDKTVPNTQYREHNGLFWFLTNEKIVKPNGELYDIGIDYYGYDPYEEKAMGTYIHEREKDFIYIADTYGVYSDDLEEHVDGDRSEKIYGGMSLLEWNAIWQSKGQDTTLIAEYNSFASPTDEQTRKVMGNNLSVEWTGWSGRYFDDFNNDEVPPWLIANYEAQYKKKWAFENGGLAFTHTSDQVIVIDEEEMESYVSFQMTPDGLATYTDVSDSNYRYWFDIVKPLDDAKVLAEYELKLSDTAEKELVAAGVPSIFPAVTHNEQNKTFYFSGDFADYTKDKLKKWQGGEHIMRMFSNEESSFFWKSYIPLIKQIFASKQQ